MPATQAPSFGTHFDASLQGVDLAQSSRVAATHLPFSKVQRKVFDALSPGAVSASQFDTHFDYSGGVLEYHGKAVVKLKGAPVVDEGDLLVV